MSSNIKNFIIALLALIVALEYENAWSRAVFMAIAVFHLIEFVVVMVVRRRVKNMLYDRRHLPDHIKAKMDDLENTLREEALKKGGALEELLPDPCDDPDCMACRIRKSQK